MLSFYALFELFLNEIATSMRPISRYALCFCLIFTLQLYCVLNAVSHGCYLSAKLIDLLIYFSYYIIHESPFVVSTVPVYALATFGHAGSKICQYYLIWALRMPDRRGTGFFVVQSPSLQQPYRVVCLTYSH